jgi:peptidyl-prolyl cis-trans isomerase C
MAGGWLLPSVYNRLSMWLENGSRRPAGRLYWYWVSAIGIVLAAGVLAACGRTTGTPTSGAGTPAFTRVASTGVPSLTPAPPSATPLPTNTPEPVFITVNGQAITLSAYERELARCQAGKTAAGFDPADCAEKVRHQLIEQAVVEQAAKAAGLTITDAEVEAALGRITAGLGGPGAFSDWLAANLYESAEFRAALQADLLRAAMSAQVTSAAVGETAEQVHALEILVASEFTAQDLLAQLQSGTDFATLALAYSRDLSSRAAGGDLGWFPRGLLTVPEVEQAAFGLQPGETSGVVASSLGFHIVRVIERDPARALSPAAAQAMRAAAWAAWLTAEIDKAVVVNEIEP